MTKQVTAFGKLYDLSKRRNKFGAKRTDFAGVIYDSKAEAKRAAELALLVRAGEITDLERQVWFDLKVNGILIGGYVADFRYRDSDGSLVVEDVKSPATANHPVYTLKKRLMKALYQIDVREVM